MSGPDTNNDLSRKEFLKQLAGLCFVASMAQSCSFDSKTISGKIMGANSARGHRLREGKFPEPTVTKEAGVLIVGGGIAGLSAARYLKENGIKDFLLLELEDEVGGNAASGENEVSCYPWGAHYIPVPDERDKELQQFLQQTGVITHYNEAGLPFYNEEYICFDPEERLYINGYWQEDLVPAFGVPADEKQQIQQFLNEIAFFRKAKGEDGKDAFCIPLYRSSIDEAYMQLDRVTFETWLKSKGYNSRYLLWYLDYCCRDDYGSGISQVSAWAGIHYFAARKGNAANTHFDTVLTWPEGNGWLVKQLRQQVKDEIETNALVYRVEERKDGTIAVCYLQNEQSVEIIADRVIMATPQFINKRIVAGHDSAMNTTLFSYAPWMVANITIDTFYENIKGTPMSWDNVIYGSKSLGYVDATHQHVVQHSPEKVLTYYLPLCEQEPAVERKLAYERSHQEWAKMIVDELSRVHPGIKAHIKNIDIWLWGHGMIRPVPGIQTLRLLARELVPTISHKIYFAHSDLSGISIFEEAFHQGINAAKRLLENDERI